MQSHHYSAEIRIKLNRGCKCEREIANKQVCRGIHCVFIYPTSFALTIFIYTPGVVRTHGVVAYGEGLHTREKPGVKLTPVWVKINK